jgi:hypothetical protein
MIETESKGLFNTHKETADVTENLETEEQTQERTRSSGKQTSKDSEKIRKDKSIKSQIKEMSDEQRIQLKNKRIKYGQRKWQWFK